MDFYTTVLRRSGGCWVALCLENGLVGQGDTKDDAIKKLKEDFLKSGRARYGWSGLSAKDQSVGTSQNNGARRAPVISAISPTSPAAAADLKVGDVILELEGRALRESADILDLVFPKRDGDSLRLKIQRGNEVRSLTLKLAERPADFISVPRRERQTSPPEPTSSVPNALPASAPSSK